MIHGKPKSARPRPPSAHVRFAGWQYERIANDAALSGVSIPSLLKTRYFAGRMPHVLLSPEDRNAVYSVLRRCRDQLNRIAENVSLGCLEGWNSECAEVAQKLTAIESILEAVYGNR